MKRYEYQIAVRDDERGVTVLEAMNELGQQGYEFVQFDEDGDALMEREIDRGREIDLYLERLRAGRAPRYDRPRTEIVERPCLQEHTHHDGDTMEKVREAIQKSLMRSRNHLAHMSITDIAFDVIREMQNEGILFREPK